MSGPFVTIVVPTLNERDCIIGTLEDLAASAKGIDHEIIVADGGSTDGTCQLVRTYAAQAGSAVRLIHNLKRIQSAAVNLAAKEADVRATILLRADAHCFYPPGFVAMTVDALSQNDAQSVVVPMFTVGDKDSYQQAVALAQNSKLGNGGSAHREGDTPSGFVDHGHHAAFDLEFFRSLGGYDETFKTNEDAEYDARVAKAGGRIWMAREAEINYLPRRSPSALAKQYFGYGRGRCATIMKHRMRPKARQMAPLLIFATMTLSLVSLPVCMFSLLPIIGYVGLTLLYSAKITAGLSVRSAATLKVCSAFVIMHNAWGAGFIAGLVDHFFRPKKGVAK